MVASQLSHDRGPTGANPSSEREPLWARQFPGELSCVDLRLLPSFFVLSEELHFGRAAARLHIAQPALSQQLKRLEQQLGLKLIERSTRRVELTLAGTTLARELTSALARVEDAISVTRQAVRVQSRALSIAAEADCFEQVRSALRAYQQRHPAQRLTLLLRSEPELEGTLASREADAVLSWSRIESRQLECRRVLRTEVGVAIPRTRELATRDSVQPADLATEPLVIFDRDDSPNSYDEILSLVGAAGRRIITAPSWTSAGTQEELLHTVSERGGIAVVSRRIFNRVGLEDLAFVPFSPAVLAPIWLIYPQAAGALGRPLAHALAEMAQDLRAVGPTRRGGPWRELTSTPNSEGDQHG